MKCPTFLGAAALAVAVASCDNSESSSDSDGTSPKPTWTGSTALDVACSTTVGVDSARHRHVYRGHEFFFCSDACRTQFKMNPDGHKTGLPGEQCFCTNPKPNCGCGHCSGKSERCACADPKS